MKKFVKPLIIAASVAAVAGIGAVSFAKWEQGTATDATVNGATGSIVTMGDITATATGLDKTLVPYDQVDQYDADAMVKGFSVKLEYDGDAGATFKMNISGDAAALIKFSTEEAGTYKAIGTDEAITIAETTGTTYYFRLETDDEADMNKDFTLTFTAVAPTVAA